MRPALQRLLSRPTSLELLRFLVGSPGSLSIQTQAGRSRRCQGKGGGRTRGYARVCMGVQYTYGTEVRISHDGVGWSPLCLSTRRQRFMQLGMKVTRRHASVSIDGMRENAYESGNSFDDNNTQPQKPFERGQILKVAPVAETAPTERQDGQAGLSAAYYGRWKTPNWTRDELDFESNLNAQQNSNRERLMDQLQHKKDMQLLARLLDHRERVYGMEGIRMFWEAVKQRQIRLPVRDYRESKNIGAPAEKLWTSFLKLGFHDNRVLEEICSYADWLFEATKRRWPRLYATIVGHFLVSGQGKEAMLWHSRLLERHPPSAIGFANLCHQTVHHRGDLNALKEIYDGNEHRNAYGKIVPTLSRQQDFKSATEWHFRLIAKGDIPLKPEHAQILTRFLAIYDRPNAVRVTKSLVAAGAPFEFTNTLSDNIRISREVMNLVHGETFKIPVKAYNDEYGARWFATTWLPLDLTMHSIYALGIREIGPLSLQALCVRNEADGSEAKPDTILLRIEQLQSIGISLGNSVYSRAVNHFAQNRMYSYLMGLLKSDQHPDSLEDWKCLEESLAYFARVRDWEQYHRTMAIRVLTTKSPASEAQNVGLRAHLTNNNLPAALDTLAQMQANGTVVKTTTMAYILQKTLIPRRKGHKVRPGSRNLEMVVTMLKGIMDAGNLVPAVYWREIIRRFGMMKSNSDFRELCIFLASRYRHTNERHPTHIDTRHTKIHRVPSQVNSTHPLHPLRILFPTAFLRSIVAFGFMHALAEAKKTQSAQNSSQRLGYESNINRQVTAGISLLKELHELGVHIEQEALKKAIFDRLVIYYGPGQSSKSYNRDARKYVPEFGLMIRLIDDAAGQPMFGSDLKDQIALRGMVRLDRRARKAKILAMKVSQKPDRFK